MPAPRSPRHSASAAARRDPRVDAYIAKAQPFARPILTHLRELVLAASPAISETIKWGMPTFMQGGILCMMAAHKAHCSFVFRHADVVPEPIADGMGQFGRLTSVDDLPAKRALTAMVKRALALDGAGPTPARARHGSPTMVLLPDALRDALATHPDVRAAFDAMPPSHRREYAEWVAEAKRDATRARRVAQALAMISERKSRNWKYER